MLIFLCSGAAKARDKKLSYRIASKLTDIGIGRIATLQDMGSQHSLAPHLRKRMIFINDCRSGCVNVLTHGFDQEKYIFLDVSPFLTSNDFNIEEFVQSQVLPKLQSKWTDLFSLNHVTE